MKYGSYEAVRATLAVLALFCLSSGPAAVADTAQPTGAIGQIVPGSGVIGVMGAAGSQVAAIYVHPGQVVKAGTLLMLTRSSTPDSDPALAKVQLDAARQLATQQVSAQSLAVQLAQKHSDEAAAALQTYESLGASVVSKKQHDTLQNAAEEAELSLGVERAKLRVVTTQTRNNLQSAQRQFELASQGTELRAPIDGTVLKIARQVGDRLGSDPAVQIGDLRAMYVVCQVYEGDLLSLRPGMKATIKAQPLARPLHGTVEQVGRMIDTRARLGEVRIKLDSVEPAARLVGMQVDVTIDR